MIADKTRSQYKCENNIQLQYKEVLAMSADFLTVENMQLCEKVFKKYMMDKYQFDIVQEGSSTNLKKLFYDVMSDIQEKYGQKKHITLKDKNNMTLNIARDFYKTNYKLNENGPNSMKPTLKTLEREQDVYGPRIMNYEQIKPEPTFKRSNVDDEFEREEQWRKENDKPNLPIVPEMKPVTENAFDPNEFMQRMNELEKKRDDMEIIDLTTMNSTRLQQDTNMAITNAQTQNPKDLYTMTTEQNRIMQKTRIGTQNDANNSIDENSNSMTSLRQDFITPPPTKTMLVERYIAVNGFDRLWDVEKSRFEFKVDFNQSENSVMQSYKNIRTVEATRVIIPMEIHEKISVNNVPKTFYNHEFSFAYPYVMLYIDEFGDVYDGTNPSIRRSFCQLVFDKCYKSPNGRGYIILNPIQREKKTFYPSALSSIGRMTLSLRKPNGDLINNSKDEYKIFKVEYELRNKRFLKIVTNIYYDKNEFYKGDNIMMRGYTMTRRDPTLTDSEMDAWNTFINRPSGHEILEIGQANDRGYFRNFYIDAPGQFDVEQGEFILDDVMITALNKYNDTIDFTSWSQTNGNILNCSLQCSFAFKVQTIVADS